MSWTVVLPFYNEEGFLGATVSSLLAQSLPCRLILVDNASTDNSAAIARELIEAAPVNSDGSQHLLITEPRAGQVFALEAGLALADSDYVAVCDADTYYPPEYLARAETLLADEDVVAVSAWPRPVEVAGWRQRLAALHRVGMIRPLPWQNHVAGSSHCFQRSALQRAGSYSATRWPFVLKDHELMARLLSNGNQAADWDHWCSPSPRRSDRKGVRWTLAERLRYHLTPRSGQISFFESWLAPRLALRNMRDTVLREQPWQKATS